jgi:hypothetical protein
VGEGGDKEKAPVAALANKVDNLEHKLDQVVNLLEASRGSAVAAATLRSRALQRLAQQQHKRLRKEYLPSAAERDRMARAPDSRRAGASAAAAGHVSTLVSAKQASAAPGELKATATAAAMEALFGPGVKPPPKSAAEQQLLDRAGANTPDPAVRRVAPGRPGQAPLNYVMCSRRRGAGLYLDTKMYV